ncbi:MAG: hypothetical protein U9R79_20365 [Armatimonadota bacterium]|nr:hypothetical protein [Armatimonadota bacterium]
MRTPTAAIALAALLGAACAEPTSYHDIIPQPKHLEVTGERWTLADGEEAAACIVVPPRQPKAAIGAGEINDRIARLGGEPLPVVECDDPAALASMDLPIVISKCYGSRLAGAIIDECDVRISPDDPGEQGYVIRFVRFRGTRAIVLFGSDPQGALYAAVTFRSLLDGDAGGVRALVASIRDWPDFKWRGTGSVHQMTGSYPVYGRSGEERVEALKLHIDWMLRCKLNLLGDYLYGGEDATKWEGADWVARINAYARARGIIGEEYQSTNVGYDERDADDPRFQGMLHTRNLFFSWSDDELIRKRAREIARVWDRLNLGMLVLHCPDGGGPVNPEMWNGRSEADRQRWGDDRASADAHVFNILYDEVHRVAPEVQVVFVIYPYNARYLDWDMLKTAYPELTREQFNRAGRDYWRQVGPKLRDDAAICVWLGEPHYMDQFRSYFGDMPMYYWFMISKGWVNAGWLVTTHRHIGTNYYGHPGDIMAVRIDRNFPNFINRLLASQFAWNTASAGAEDFSGSYYDFRTDNDEPEVIVEQWGERACRHMWGAKVGPVMHQAFNKGIIPALIVNPSRMLNDENRGRRRRGLEPLELTPQMMLEQAEGCGAAAEALDAILDMDAEMNDLQERLFVYYLRRTHCLAAYARAHYHLLLAQQALAEGDEQEVAAGVAAGKRAVEDGRADMERVLEATAEMRSYDPKYTRQAEEGISPAIPGTDADFPRMTESLEAVTRRYRDAQLEFEPVTHEGPVRVAIYDPSDDGGTAIGHHGWMLTLQTAGDIEAEFIDDLSLSNLISYEALLYPQSTSGRSVSRYEYFEVLRRYVEEVGGGVMFGHHQVGHHRAEFGAETTFPAICRGAADRVDSYEVVVAGDHPITEGLSAGQSYRHVYYDHFTVQPGAKATVVLKDRGSAPVMVAGGQGKGRVIYDGQIILSDSAGDVAAAGHEREVFLNAVRWLAHRR